MISPSASNNRLTERGLWNTFRTSNRDDQVASAAVEYVSRLKRGAAVAILHDGTSSGGGLAEEFRQRASRSGFKEVLFERLELDVRNLSPMVAGLQSAKPDVVFWDGDAERGGSLVREMRGAQIQAKFVGGANLASEKFAAVAGAAALDTIVISSPDPELYSWNSALARKFEGSKAEAGVYSYHAYAAFQLIVHAVDQSKSNDPKRVADALRSGKVFPTAVGGLEFDSKGDRRSIDSAIHKWRLIGGRMTLVLD